MLLMTPGPATWTTWSSVVSNLRNVNLASLEEVDRLDDPSESLASRPKQASAGRKMVAYASKDSRQREVKPMWSPRSARARKVGPLVDGAILQDE